ncbi:Ras-like protein [Acrasis kona]|uniref:Ras-like protein n=1 Tax=Acrasis kona TaxID=1008807 RepID=A0AAW2YN94_9EUKA
MDLNLTNHDILGIVLSYLEPQPHLFYVLSTVCRDFQIIFGADKYWKEFWKKRYQSGTEVDREYKSAYVSMEYYKQLHDSSKPFKIAILGIQGSGKSSLINRFCNDSFDPTAIPNEDSDENHYKLKTYIDGDEAVIDVMDTGYWEPLMWRSEQILPNQHFIVVFSITDETSIRFAQIHLQMIDIFKSSGAVVVLVSTMNDLEAVRTVNPDLEAKTAARYGCEFIRTSSKTGLNVIDLFTNISRQNSPRHTTNKQLFTKLSRGECITPSSAHMIKRTRRCTLM